MTLESTSPFSFETAWIKFGPCLRSHGRNYSRLSWYPLGALSPAWLWRTGATLWNITSSLLLISMIYGGLRKDLNCCYWRWRRVTSILSLNVTEIFLRLSIYLIRWKRVLSKVCGKGGGIKHFLKQFEWYMFKTSFGKHFLFRFIAAFLQIISRTWKIIVYKM